MFRSLLTILCLSLFFGCSDEEPFVRHDGGVNPKPDGPISTADLPPPPPPERFKLATWNVKNLFDAVDDPQSSDDVPKSYLVDQKLAQLGAALRAMDADVVALQEVENRNILDKLVSKELPMMRYYSKIMEGNDGRGIDVALLSRYPVTSYETHVFDSFKGSDGKSYSFSRDCPEAVVDLDRGRTLVLLINHLRSGSATTDPEAVVRRVAQAKRVREIANAQLKKDPQVNLAVIGDLNDSPGSTAVNAIISGQPPLVDLTSSLPADQRYTTRFKDFKTGKYLQLDFILASPGLNKDIRRGSVKILRDKIYSTASDHYPLLAEFDLQ